MDSLAAGIVSIAAASFAVLAASFGRSDAAVLAAIICGATLAFLRHNYHPAKIFMGDSGALALGFLLATVAVEGVLKTAATIALVAPLLVLAVPILDTSFVVLKRLKYRRPPWDPDQNHFYHRFMRIGLSQRRTAAYLHLWALLLAAWAVMLRFVPPRPRGEWNLEHVADRGRYRARGRRGVDLDGLQPRDPEGTPPPRARLRSRARRGASGRGAGGSRRARPDRASWLTNPGKGEPE